ncbi:hypothetical protein BJ741DRAFT_602438 [Chytriomyces cf. hyalinus JEL632]|nr:hypothetical protein BJ741DRAFT_602438 [Chytriomyces cf. hyalinus JEL632]
MSVVVGNSDFRPLLNSPTAKITGVHESLLQECEKDIIWYRENFFGKPHDNYLALESTKGPLAISVILDGGVYKALVRSIEGSERLTVEGSAVYQSTHRKLFKLGPKVENLMSAFSSGIPARSLTLVKNPGLANELLSMEERQVIRSYKFGVAYCTAGQTTEAEMLSNRHDSISPGYKAFLQFLGETIELRGWKGYRAGLDVSGTNQTGTHAVYTKWQGYEIMFHVATMLPYNEKDKQQLERKRHLGNDIVVIVYQDTDEPFQLSSISSHQNHILAFVKPDGEGYRFTCAVKQGVPTFIPEIPDPPVFGKDAVSRDFFLHTLVNGERASYKSTSFAPKISRTRSVLLCDVASKHLK